jgi:hypothetical protein
MRLISTDSPYSFLNSEHALFINEALSPYAEGVLQIFTTSVNSEKSGAGESLSRLGLKNILRHSFTKLSLNSEAIQHVPHLISTYCQWLETSGNFPVAGVWVGWCDHLETEFLGWLRTDGSIRGETFKNVSKDAGRNDPCPCGSGKKFKKCCLPLIL